ncbi:MFS transporter [Lachnoclostridium sp. Marseille-P6806]|uniref:MFS transporter n=1 Tax=Lachnoclostridium sp. Marseille-P6806 TaxID=2364793 RepID=UPI001030D3BF|nr:MFS transporter [Lachnoclostridium sp. Marseille-P6806]
MNKNVGKSKRRGGSALRYDHTLYACFMGYIVQAIVNNFVPLLFLTFGAQYGLPLSRITFLATFNFALQLLIDMVSAGFIDRIGYRAAMILADAFAAAGLLLLTVLPERMSDPFAGILISVLIYAVGGGLLEVVVSPIVEACPTKRKEQAMSLLHSFYCWGQMGVVLISTLFFHFAGIRQWKIMAVLWALVPLCNLLLFFFVPVAHLIGEGEKGLRLRELVRLRLFWLIMLMMLCAGASEQAVSQWASAFAESGLGVSKTLGDLAGPMMFALFMGASRSVFAKFGERLRLERFMLWSALLCVACYLLIALSRAPALGLLGCALCGFSVGIFWPGTFSIASPRIRNGGTLMFALFALAGDAGCSLGPTVVGTVAAASGNHLKTGILAAIVFPILMLLWLLLLQKRNKKRGALPPRV